MLERESESNIQLIQRPFLRFEKGHALSALDPVLQSILLHRGIEGEEDCDSSLSKLYPFQALKGIREACLLLEQALNKNAKILVVGDFDADGATSTAVAMKGLKAFGFSNVGYLVPDRFKFGYGLSTAIVDLALKDKPDLIITVDNGISSIEGVAHARASGIDVLVTDHHLPGKVLPDANVILNPNQPQCEFPSKNLAGVGVMFYLLVGLRAFLREQGYFTKTREPNLASLLDLVALGTVVDLVPLDINNRRLIQQGLARIRSGKACAGIKALIEVSRKDEAHFKSTDFAFALGPRINAAGRLDSMSLGIECLLCDSFSEAIPLAQALNDLNEDRKHIEAGMKKEALELLPEVLQEMPEESIICLFDERWHQGVVGIVASRLKEQFHLPSIIFAVDDENPGVLKGSARSIMGLHMRDLLGRVATLHPGLLKKFGGHAMAAGMSIEKSHFELFRTTLQKVTKEMLSTEKEDLLQAKKYLDGPLETKHLSLEFAKTLQGLEPWGQHFPEPVFSGEFSVLSENVLAEKHLKWSVKMEGQENPVEAIAFNVAHKYGGLAGGKVRFLYRLDINYFRGMETLQLQVEKIIL